MSKGGSHKEIIVISRGPAALSFVTSILPRALHEFIILYYLGNPYPLISHINNETIK